MNHPYRRYYAWANADVRLTYVRLWLNLPLMLFALPMIALLVIARIAGVRIAGPLDLLMQVLLWFCLAGWSSWLSYLLWRFASDLWRAARYFKREAGPQWVSGWRGAWRLLRVSRRR